MRYYNGKDYQDFHGIVWYDIHADTIIVNSTLDAYFAALVSPACGWERLEILGFL